MLCLRFVRIRVNSRNSRATLLVWNSIGEHAYDFAPAISRRVSPWTFFSGILIERRFALSRENHIMMLRRWVGVAVVAVCIGANLSVSSVVGAEEAVTMKAGVAKAVITPDNYKELTTVMGVKP